MIDMGTCRRRADINMVASSSSEEPLCDSGSFHRPVMVDTVCDLVSQLPAGTFLDATLGGAGHAKAILENSPQLCLLGIDQDPAALDHAKKQLVDFGDRVRLKQCRFDQLDSLLLEKSAGTEYISGFLFDLGVSSHQLDVAERGFSYSKRGPLDMRMNPSVLKSAADVVNKYREDELSQVIKRYGDERFANRIAAAIVRARPISNTAELSDVVRRAIPAPARRSGGHPAKRTFQAIRIEVNQELTVLEPALEFAIGSLVPKGRGIAISYHSGEDRTVKRLFRQHSSVGDQPPDLPVEPQRPDYRLPRPLMRRPSKGEQDSNPRSSSARLRCIERLTTEPEGVIDDSSDR